MSQVELDQRNQEAIQAALDGHWDKASTINAELSEDYPEDIDVLNRLAKAYTELGQINKAGQTYSKVLEIDPYNPIAVRNQERLSTLRGSVKHAETNVKPINPEIFLEEPGKTKTVDVRDLAMPKVLVELRVGDNIELKANKTDVSVVSSSGQRLGKLDDSWGQEIAQAAGLGSSFSAIVKSVNVSKSPQNSSLSVFVKETTHSKKLANPIFPIDSNFTPYVRENTLSYLKNENDEPVVTETTDETEELPVEDIPHDGFEETAPPAIDLTIDEEDLSSS